MPQCDHGLNTAAVSEAKQLVHHERNPSRALDVRVDLWVLINRRRITRVSKRKRALAVTAADGAPFHPHLRHRAVSEVWW